jgi:ribonuclease P protein component
VLPAGSRLRRRQDFTVVVRRGRRAGRPSLVAHLYLGPTTDDPPAAPARAGFVVSKAVGGAVTRNTVERRLRHLMRERLELLPRGSMLVVRALPPAATATSARLGADLDAVLDRLVPGGRAA